MARVTDDSQRPQSSTLQVDEPVIAFITAHRQGLSATENENRNRAMRAYFEKLGIYSKAEVTGYFAEDNPEGAKIAQEDSFMIEQPNG